VSSMATVSFKLDDALYAELQELAGQRTGLSANILCREIIIDHLKDAGRERVCSALTKIEQDLQQLHKDAITGTYVLLLMAGKLTDRQEAKAWIAKNMLGPALEENG